MEKMKVCWKMATVKISVAAVILAAVSLFLPWFTFMGLSQSMMDAISADPEFFTGFLPVLIIAMLWVVVFFLLNHPKLTLVGDAALLFVGVGTMILGMDRGLNPGLGAGLFVVAVLVCIVCAFLTKKQRRPQ